jgi:hypothetical protein
VPQRGSIPIWDTDMYLPTVSRGRNTSTDTPSSVSAALSKDSQIDDYMDRQTVKREGSEAPPDNRSFSKMIVLKSVNGSRQLIFKFNDLDYPADRGDNSIGSVTPGAHDVIAIDTIQCRPYPPDGRRERTHLKEADSSSCVYDKVHLSESLLELKKTEIGTGTGRISEHTSASHSAHAEAQPSTVRGYTPPLEEQGQLTHDSTQVPSQSLIPPLTDGDKRSATLADALYECADSAVQVPRPEEAEVNTCVGRGSGARKRNGSTQDDDSNHDDIEFVKTSLQEMKVECEIEKDEGRDGEKSVEAKDSMFSFPRYGSQPAHTMLEENASDDAYIASTTGTLDLPPPDRGFFSWFLPSSYV